MSIYTVLPLNYLDFLPLLPSVSHDLYSSRSRVIAYAGCWRRTLTHADEVILELSYELSSDFIAAKSLNRRGALLSGIGAILAAVFYQYVLVRPLLKNLSWFQDLMVCRIQKLRLAFC